MKITDGRVNFLSRKMAVAVVKEGLMAGKDPDFLTKEIKKGFNFFLQRLEVIDQKVRSKISSLKRGVPEGSSEYDILYRQYYHEELEKM